jgi:hypothetical protein
VPTSENGQGSVVFVTTLVVCLWSVAATVCVRERRMELQAGD